MSNFKRIGPWFLLTALAVTGAQTTFATGGNAGDFNNDGSVDLADFLAFASMFGTSMGEVGYDARGDFDNDGTIGLSDFLIFARNFGKRAPSSGAGGPVTVVGTEGSEGDQLVFRSFKVSETRLNAGQAFTMETMVQKPRADGLSQRINYYRSLDATIDSSDALIHWGYLFAEPWSGVTTDTTAVLDWSAPAYAGTYHYGVCVQVGLVGSRPAYYCSKGIPVTVDGSHPGSPDLMVHPSLLIPDIGTPGSQFTWESKIENVGTGPAAATSGRRYRSDDTTIDATDMPWGILSVPSMDSTGYDVGALLGSAPDETGTYYMGICIDPVPGETNTENNCSVGTRFIVQDRGSPDLDVRGAVFTESSDRTTWEIFLHAYLLNTGDGTAGKSIARYYRSDDAIIDASDTEIGTGTLHNNRGLLGPDRNITVLYGIEVPTSPGTYYYGVCFDPVPGETETNNNCSEAVSLNVGVPDLAFGPTWVSTSNPLAGQSFMLTAAVRNEGPAAAGATTVRYYRSDDATIDASDTEVATGAIDALMGIDGLVLGIPQNRRRAAYAASREAIRLNAPSSPGTYYYGACVDGVSGETDTDNNCSDGVYVRVVPPGADPFNIELVFVDDFTDARKDLMQQAARRFEAIITEGLPDVDFSTNGFDFVADGGRVTRKIGDIVDDLRIFVLKTHEGTYAGRGGPDFVRSGNPIGLPAVGAIFLDSFFLARIEGAESIRQEERMVRNLMLHELAHVLGFGSLWKEFDLLKGPTEERYFSGELAIQAFNVAGGEPYVGKKVPVESRWAAEGCGSGSHWNPDVFKGLHREFRAEVMEPAIEREEALSAITIQSLADLGYSIDVNHADPYRLPATVGWITPPTASAKPVVRHMVEEGVTALGPIYVGDEQGNIIRTIED